MFQPFAVAVDDCATGCKGSISVTAHEGQDEDGVPYRSVKATFARDPSCDPTARPRRAVLVVFSSVAAPGPRRVWFELQLPALSPGQECRQVSLALADQDLADAVHRWVAQPPGEA